MAIKNLDNRDVGTYPPIYNEYLELAAQKFNNKIANIQPYSKTLIVDGLTSPNSKYILGASDLKSYYFGHLFLDEWEGFNGIVNLDIETVDQPQTKFTNLHSVAAPNYQNVPIEFFYIYYDVTTSPSAGKLTASFKGVKVSLL